MLILVTMVLSIKCLSCGFEYESKYQMDEQIFKTAAIENRNETCPKCGVISIYNKENYNFT